MASITPFQRTRHGREPLASPRAHPWTGSGEVMMKEKGVSVRRSREAEDVSEQRSRESEKVKYQAVNSVCE